MKLSSKSHCGEDSCELALTCPLIGAQIFIERGQTPERVDTWFQLLKEHDLKLCRIRLFETYMYTPDGNWDFTLFDHAFRAGEKYGVKILGTLFPSTEFTNVGGFKFPKSDEHLAAIAEYIRNVTVHFRQFRSLYGWVLVNEPGCGKAPDEPFTRNRFTKWQTCQPVPEYNSKGYSILKFADEKFLLDYNVWYLDWLAKEVRKYDDRNHIHVNNHDIFKKVAEYDFPRWRGFLDSLGGSAHASWHYGYFERNRYAHAMSANCEIIRSGAGELPWLITEIQGGNNTYSGLQPMCPTAEEISQWLWILVGSGGKGGIFWCLNPRASGTEAGEWAMLNFLDEPSDRLTAAGEVARILNRFAALFATAQPEESGIDVLYVRESLWVENVLQSGGTHFEGRMVGGVMKSALGYFEALGELGVMCGLKEIGEFDFLRDDYRGKTLILAHQVAVPSRYWPSLGNFVRLGGKLIVDGLTAYYDENAHCIMQTGFPLRNLFGGCVREFKLEGNLFDVALSSPVLTLTGHCWRGTLQNKFGKAVGERAGEVTGIRNSFGHGETFWVPSLLGLGARLNDNSPLAALLADEAAKSLAGVPISFRQRQPGMLMKTLRTDSGYLTILINKSVKSAEICLEVRRQLRPTILFANKEGTMMGAFTVAIHPEETIVINWERNC